MRALLLSALVLAVLAPPAAAFPVVATDGSSLTRFDTNTIAEVQTTPVTGLLIGETLVGIDYRVANGQLYGIGSTNKLYLINPQTGAATQVGAPDQFTLAGSMWGMDFN